MKTFFSKSLLAVAMIFFVFASCRKEEINQKRSEELQFTNLSADNYSIATASSAKVAATVQNACPQVNYEWSASAGTIDGNKSLAVFNAPATSCSATITCIASHPGKQSVTKSITIAVGAGSGH